jgi:hypothetical protein
MRKSVVPDTNIFLHYDIMSIDWCKELSADEVEIIVCTTVLSELDKEKNDGNETIADRARRNLSLIASNKGKEIRKDVRISLMLNEPKIDWSSFDLDSTLNDDRILAFILERGKQDILVTLDYTPRLKGEALGITVANELSCERLPNPKSEERKEMEKMQKEIMLLKNRVPQLWLDLDTSDRTKEGLPRFTVKTDHNIYTEQIEKIISEREQELQAVLHERVSKLLLIPVDVEGYKVEVKGYLESYRKYIAAKKSSDEEYSKILEMNLVLSCEKAPAEDVYCYLEFPNEFKILEKDELPEIPIEPTKPIPTSGVEKSLSQLSKLSNLQIHGVSSIIQPYIRTERNVTWNVEENMVEIQIKKINHGFGTDPITVYVKLPSFDLAKSFHIAHTVRAANLVEPIKEKLPIIIEKI